MRESYRDEMPPIDDIFSKMVFRRKYNYIFVNDFNGETIYIYFCVSHTRNDNWLVQMTRWGQLSDRWGRLSDDDLFEKRFWTIKQKENQSAIWTLSSGTMDTTNLLESALRVCVKYDIVH